MGRLSVLAAVGTAVSLLMSSGGSAAEMAAPAKAGSITLTRLVQKLPAGKEWLIYQEGLLCITRQKIKADGVQTPVALDSYTPLFAREFGAAGIGKQESTNLFADASDKVEGPAYEVGALVHDMDLKVCIIGESILRDVRVKGGGAIKVQWQIYSPAKRAVVATIETVGEATLKNTGYRVATDIPEGILRDAFADSVRKLAASPNFKALMDAPPPVDELRSAPGQQAKIAAVGAAPAPRSVADSVGSVVLVHLPASHGSGVLVSTDGYVLTNAHVVGQAKTVKIRWSDGYETEGQVLRVHKDRDVALVKTDTHGRQPLPTRFGAMQPGETVMAIGAPLEAELQNTVTRGIVSAGDRILDGYRYIQSDVMVNPGNSGGALIDDKGHLVALTVMGRRINGAPTGLNFFIPIRDALDFLSLDLVPGSAPAGRPLAAQRGAAR